MQKMSFLNKLSLYTRPKTIYRSEDGYIEVRDSMENRRPVRVLYCDGIRETGIYLDEGMNTDPLFYYMQTLKEITLYYDGLDKALLIGGGGMAFPKYYLSWVPEGQMTVIEKDGRMIDMARKYFYYTEDDRIRIVEGDGTAFISKTATSNAAIVNGKGLKKYDLIIFDAFTGKKTPKELFSEGVFKLTKQINSDKGILAINMLNDKNGAIAMQTHLAQAMLKNIYKNTKIINCHMGWNCILLASDRVL